ncbi:MAG: hypothetical protein KIT84_19040 [Labilithrix sp.]|nr:hypothetical protein [Labilithrix sp.]MCW5813131.1 hypothetical protein [Labilithrix sp.]
MRPLHAIFCLVLLPSAVACTSANDEPTTSSEAQMTDTGPVLDCTKPGSFPEEAMLALPGTYERVGASAANTMRGFTIGALEDIAGWAGKNASYTRDVTAPCMDFVAIGDGSSLTKDSPLPMTSDACAGQTGTITTLMDNPALGAFLSFEDASGLPFGKDFYFVTSSRIEDDKLVAMCLSSASGEQFLVTRKGP